MFLFVGKVTRFFFSIAYFFYAIIAYLRIKAYNVRFYHAKSFLDCGVDNDDNPLTCVSSYDLDPSFKMNITTILAGIMFFSGVFQFLLICVGKIHTVNIFRYVDNIITNPLLILFVCVLSGIQEIKLLFAIYTGLLAVEFMYAVHDYNVDKGGYKVLFPIWITQLFLGGVLISSLTYYLSNSENLPVSILVSCIGTLVLMTILRCFHIQFYYYTIPNRIAYNAIMSDVKEEEPFLIDWSESWTNLMYFFIRSLVVLSMFLDQSHEITYV